MESRPDWFNISRVSPEYVCQIKGRETIFTYHNTKLYIFPDELKHFNHVFFHNEEEDKFVYIFVDGDESSQAVMDELHAYGYPMMYEPWPSEQDVEAYVQSELQDLDSLPPQA